MTNISNFRCVALVACTIAMLPAAAVAGTRASDSKVQPVAAAKASPAGTTQGPKNGFPSAPGLSIATIKANDNAAFKRKSNGT